jgi:hypothetical protein
VVAFLGGFPVQVIVDNKDFVALLLCSAAGKYKTRPESWLLGQTVGVNQAE